MLLAFILLVLVLVKLRETGDKPAAFFECIVVWNLWSFMTVEVLSYAKMLTVQAVAISWGAFCLFLVGCLLKAARRGGRISGLFAELWHAVSNNKLLWLTGMIVVALALLTVPYNWDSMTYHLPRMMHWAQNRSVAHYAANDIRQLVSPVLAEFINVQVYLLSGERDIFWNLLQAVSYLVNAWIVYKIACKIGADNRYAYLSTLLFMTMPIAYSEALNTQVDLFASLWLLIFTYYFIDLFEAPKLTADRDTLQKCLMMAACISLGFLAKPSVDVGMAVLLFGLLVKCIKRADRWRELAKIIVCVLPFVLLPLIPEWVRNYHTFSALGDSQVGGRQLVGTLAPHYILVNLIKNFAQNWPNIYLYDSAEWMAKIVSIAAVILRVDINAPSISEDGRAYMMNEAPNYNHDTATNPVVVILATLCFVWYVLRRRKSRNAGDHYTLYSMILFIVFCAIVRWEPFVTRYMLAYLALLCPMIGYQVQMISYDDKAERIKRAAVPIIYFLCLTELFSLTRYHQEMWHESAFSRPVGYFNYNRAIRIEYEEVFGWINEKEYSALGIKVSAMTYEYPIWVMMKNPDKHVENILVDNASNMYEDMTYIPECVVIDLGLEDDEIITVHGQSYHREPQFMDNEHLAVYVKE